MRPSTGFFPAPLKPVHRVLARIEVVSCDGQVWPAFAMPLLDGAAVVRSLHDAALLAIDDATASRRVIRKKIEGVEVIGVVLTASTLQGYVEWKRRWQRAVPGERHGE